MKTLIGRLLLAAALIAGSPHSYAQEKVPRESRGVEDATAAALARLRAESRTPVQVSYTGTRLRFASFDVVPEAPADARPAERALAFLDQYGALYTLPAAPRDVFFVSRVVENESGTHVFFDQRIGDVAVYGGQLAVHLNGARVVSTNGDYTPDAPANPLPRVDASRASEIASKDLGADTRIVGSPRLSYFDWRLIEQPVVREGRRRTPQLRTQLAWRLAVTGGKEQRGFDYFIDADSGAVLARFPTESNAKDIWIRTASSSGEAIFCNFGTPTDWFTEAGAVPFASPVQDAEGFSAFTSTNTIYDFFFNNFGWRSWNGNDNQIRHNLDVGTQAGNAYFSGFCGHMAFGNNMSVLDVMAHEFTHGVVQSTAGLGTSFQGGALNESYGDIFGALIDTKDWTIGESTPGGFIRSLANPPLSADSLTIGCGPLPPFTGCAINPPAVFAHPDRMSLFIANATNDMAGDFGAVHANTGIPNKAAFLIAAGGTHNGVTVTGIGRFKLGRLYHDVLSSRLTNNATFSQAASATITAAANAATTGRFGFTRADACTVLNSFAAVELASPDLDCDGMPDAIDPDDDMDSIPDLADNCPRVANPTQGNLDGDSLGDACDTDADNDGRLNTSDNCPRTANASQADFDHDGFGDACDDSDADSSFDSVDNCVYVRNTDQSDIDADGIGNACDADLDNDGRLNTNDNCPVIANVSQLDSDGDGMGNACDSCPNNIDSGTDTDHDGLDNACDADDDNDGVADSGDNCPLVANASQSDFNGNGIGSACDEKEQVKWHSDPVVFDGFIDRWLEQHQLIEVPIIPDPRDPRTCSPFGDGPAMQITIKAEFPFTGGVVDDRGRYVGSFDSAQGGTMQFQPAGDFCALKLSGKEGSFDGAFLGRSYFLQIAPGGDRAFPGARFSVGVRPRGPK